MKIAIIAHQRFPLKEPYAGGLEMITHSLVMELEKLGHYVDVYAPGGSEVKNLVDYNQDIPVEVLHQSKFDHDELNSVRENVIYSRIFQHLDENAYDIIHNHSHHYLPIILGNRTKSTFITSFHTPVFPELDLALRILDQNFNQSFTTVSHSLKSAYSYLIPEAETIYNGIDVQNWSYSLDDPKDYCIWYGRVCKEKAPHLAIEASLKANTKILLAGPGMETDYFSDKVAPLIAAHPEAVKYLGHLEQKELNTKLQNARAFLFTSTWEEPYGLAIAESLASGTPVISWNKGAAPEILTPECGDLIPAFDLEAMATSLCHYSRFSRKACRQRAEGFCDKRKMVEAYIKLYQKLTERKDILC